MGRILKRKKSEEDDIGTEEESSSSYHSNSETVKEPTNFKKTKKSKPSTDVVFYKSDCKEKSLYFIGAHVSIGKGFSGAIERTHQMKAKALAIFLNGQKSWNAADKTISNTDITAFHKALAKHSISIDKVLPHASYLINLGSPDTEKLEKSKQLCLNEIKRAASLGIKLYNFHPGSTLNQISEKKSCQIVAESINWIHQQPESKDVILVIENTAGQGNNIGYKFEHLAWIIEQVSDKQRVGVCIDTCHMFAAGYDIRTPKAFKKTFAQFDATVGFQYLKGMHLNDSKGNLGCRTDRHELIGKGCIGLGAFDMLLNDPRFQNIPLCLETATSEHGDEIDLLYSLVKPQKKDEKQETELILSQEV